LLSDEITKKQQLLNRMKNSEIRELTTQEIVEKIAEGKAQLVKMRLNHAITPLDNTNQITNSRRDVARLLTELSVRVKKQNA